MDDGKAGHEVHDSARGAFAGANAPAEVAGRSLRATLLVPLALLLLLLTLVGAMLVYTQWTSQQASAESALRDASARLVLVVRRELTVEQSMLEALTLSPAIDRQDWVSHYLLAQRVASRREGALIALTDESGQLIYNTAVPLGTPLPNVTQFERQALTQEHNGEVLPLSSQGLTRRARQSGNAAYSDLYFGFSIRRPTLALAVPVERDGAIPYTLTFAFPPDALNAVLAADAEVRGYRLLVADGNGRVIAASADDRAVLGRTLPEPLRALADPGRAPKADGNVRSLSYLDAGEMTVTARHIPGTGWTAIAAVTPDVVYAPVQRTVVGWLLATLTVLALGWFLALRLASRISRPLMELTRRAEGPADARPWPSSGVREIGALTHALREAEHVSAQRNAAVVEMQVAAARAKEARQAESEVREREAQLRLALLAGRLGFWRLDDSGAVSGDNLFRQAWALQDTTATVAAAELLAQVAERDRERVRRFFASDAETPGRRSVEQFAVQTAAGQRWLSLWADVLLDEHAKRAGLIGVVADVSARVFESEQLGDRSTQLRVAIGSALAVAFEWDIPGDRVRRWQSAEPALPETASSRFDEVLAAVHPDDRALFQANVRQALHGADCEYRSEHRLVRPDGQVRWLRESGRVLRDAEQRPLRLVGVSFDVTEQKQLMLQLQDSRENYRRLLNSIDQGFCVLQMLYDAADQPVDYRFIEINRNFELHTGLRSAVGRTALELVPDLEWHWIDRYDRVARTGESARFELHSQAMQRTFAVEAVRVGEPAGRKVALLFSDISQMRAAESKLRDSEQRYRLMFQHHPHPMWVYDQETLGFLEVNDAALAHYGYSREDFATMTIADIRPPEDRPRLEEEVAATVRGLSERGTLWRHRRKDGSLIDVQISSHPFEYAGRRAALVLSMDVTEQRRAQQHLERTSETFYRLVQNDPFGVYIVDSDFRLREASKGTLRAFGGIDPLIGRDFAEVVTVLWGAAAAGIIQRFRHTLATGEPYSESLTDRRADRALTESYDWRIERVTLPDGRFGVVCYFYDLSERQRWEQQLQESEARFRATADGLPLIVWVHDAEGRQEFVNQTFCDYFDVTREQMRDGRWQVLIHPDDMQAYVEGFLDCVRGRRPFHAECRVRRGDGQWRWMENWARPRFDASGQFLGMVGAGADITDRKRIDEDLRNADRQKDEFLATLAHELRNPLAPIRNVTQLLEMNPSHEVVARGTQILRRQVRQMNRLLDDLLDVSRLTLKRLRLQTQPLDLHDVIADALEQSRPLLDSAGQTVVLHLPDGPVMVDGDRERLAQVLSNLLNNAARYAAGPAEVVVGVAVTDGKVELSVRDRGMGIAPEDLPRIFGMLVQGQAGYQTTKSGLGIGLSLVRGLVELHGGSVQARSDGLGKGAEFIVRLPVLPSTPRLDHDTSPALSAAGGERILVVDDNVDSADSMALLLSTLGYATRTAYNGTDALRAAQNFAPAVALLDIGLPDIDGLEVARRLKASSWGRGIHLIALSGWGQADDKRRSTEVGIEAHLTKPADPAQLRDLLEAVLRKASA
jgi:PAS domain S-box-containing protein